MLHIQLRKSISKLKKEQENLDDYHKQSSDVIFATYDYFKQKQNITLNKIMVPRHLNMLKLLSCQRKKNKQIK